MRALIAIAVCTAACGYDSPVTPPDGGDLPTVGFGSPTSLVDELSDQVEIPVVLSAAGNATVDFSVTGGSATAGTDFTLPAGTLAFGGTTQNIDLSILADALEEPNETIEITLSNPTGATLGQASHVVTISSDILPRVRFVSTVTSEMESTTANLDVQLDLAPTAPVSVTIALSGTAVGNGTDYSLANNTVVTFGIGETMKQIPLDVNPDALDEFDEDVIADLTSPSGLVIDTTSSTTTHTIIDDDAPPTIQFDNATNAQPEGKADASQTVSLSAPSGKTITIDYAKTGGTAGNSDVTIGGTGTLTFLPGQVTQTIPITIADDTLFEADETAVITLSNATNATLGTAVHTLTIENDDAAPTVAFMAPTTTVTEGTATITVTVVLSAESGLPATVQFARNAGSTAAVTTDFAFVTASPLSFSPGVTSQDITISIANDAIGEVDEALIIDLLNPTGATLGAQDDHTVTITDNDCLGTGLFRVCPAAAPTVGTVAIPAGTFNTTNNALCQTTQPAGWTTGGQDPVCLVAAENITITGATTLVGTRPLVLFATGTITVSGSLDASAGATQANGHAGASTSCAAFLKNSESNANGGGGGAGASFMSAGGNGGGGNNGDLGAEGGTAPLADAADPLKLRPGCKGQNGGNGTGGTSGGAGGGAGGAVYLVAATISIAGSIDVSGGGGARGTTQQGAGGGGGSGGMILLDATTVNAGGVLIANGGGAGQGADDNTNGGNGGDPSVDTPTTPALGGNVGGNAGAIGGNGMVTGTQATNGAGATAGEGGGGGGGGGGFIKSSGAITGAVSAGKIVMP
jgi:hypothetical protein